MKKIIFLLGINMFGFFSVKSLTLKIINKMKDHDLTIFRDNFKDFTLMPGKSEEIKNFQGESLPYGVAKKLSMGIPERAGNMPIKDALKNPYPDGVSVIEVSKGFISGLDFKTILKDSREIMKLSSKNINEWTKVLGLSNNAKPQEILGKAGFFMKFDFKPYIDKAEKVLGLDYPTRYDYDLLNKFEKSFKEKWNLASENIKVKIQGAINQLRKDIK